MRVGRSGLLLMLSELCDKVDYPKAERCGFFGHLHLFGGTHLGPTPKKSLNFPAPASRSLT